VVVVSNYLLVVASNYPSVIALFLSNHVSLVDHSNPNPNPNPNNITIIQQTVKKFINN
jgi:hypothetical protein